MKTTVMQIAKLIEGVIEGDENVEIFTLSKIEEAREGALTVIPNIERERRLGGCKASEKKTKKLCKNPDLFIINSYFFCNFAKFFNREG